MSVFGLAVGFFLAGCIINPKTEEEDNNNSSGNKTPTETDYTIGNLDQIAGKVTAVTIKSNSGKSPGAVTIYYEGKNDDTPYAKSNTPPQTSGVYSVNFNVAAAKGWNAASGLNAGDLIVNSPASQIPVSASLVYNVWADGALTSANNEQWFKFTATASTQNIHVKFGTLADLYISLYDKDANTLGNSIELYDTGYSSKTYTSLTVTSGQTYYIKVTPYGSRTGIYQIAFNTIYQAPGILEGAATLTAENWTNGVINAENNENWYKFTATAGTHYVHVKFGTLTDLYVRLYDSNGSTLGDSIELYETSYSKITYKSFMVTSGQTYYIKVTPYGSRTGTYQITLNTSTTAP